MAPRKKAPSPEGTTYSESDEHASQPSAHDVMPAIMANIVGPYNLEPCPFPRLTNWPWQERTKGKRKTVRKNIEADFLAAMVGLETRMAKRYEAEISKRYVPR
jgi:hypothetical protein